MRFHPLLPNYCQNADGNDQSYDAIIVEIQTLHHFN
jgi:hypothetical protein